MSLTEHQIINLIKTIFQPILATGAKGLLDDGAELPPCSLAHTRVVSTDAFQENNDFKIGFGSLESAGYRAMIQNLSDLAALGAKPVGFLWSLEIPKLWLSNQAVWLQEFCLGTLNACQEYHLEFYGGDLSHAQNAFSCTITIFGDVLGRPVGRQGAQAGNRIYISKSLGASAAGLKNLLNLGEISQSQCHLYPSAEINLGQKLVPFTTACMDISDGLIPDLSKLCKASQVGAELEKIPTHWSATQEQALYGGEDYALLFTTPEPCPWGIEIGKIISTHQIKFLGEPISIQGFDHFSPFSKGQAPR